MPLPGCHHSAGRTSPLQTQEEPRAGGKKGDLLGRRLGRTLPAQPVSLLELDPLFSVMFPHVYLFILSRVITCGCKGGANHR